MRIVRILAFLGLLTLTSCGSETTSVMSDAPRTEQPEPASMTTSASCVEQYSEQTLTKRDYAFDGTVDAIEPGAEDAPDEVTIDVHKWFKGGSGPEASRRAFGFTGVTSAGGSPHVVGERLLVAGDDDYIWECGFTQPYDASVASDWENAFGA